MALNVHDCPIDKLLLPCRNGYQTSLVRNIAPCIVGLTLAVNLATLYSRVDPGGQPGPRGQPGFLAAMDFKL